MFVKLKYKRNQAILKKTEATKIVKNVNKRNQKIKL